MWPFSVVSNILAERKLRQECLDEILEAVRSEGIELSSCRLTTDRRDFAGVDNYMRRELEKVKNQGVGYGIEFLIDKHEHVDSTHENSIIGKTRNPHYDSLIYDYQETNKMIDGELAKIAQELYGEWLIDIEHGIWMDDFAKVNRLDEIPFHTYVPTDSRVLHLKGRHNEEELVRKQSIWSQIYIMYEKAFAGWESVSMNEWEKMAKEEGLWCRCCSGQGYYFTGGYQEGPIDHTCGTCEGTGRVYPTVQEYRDYFKPKEPTLKFSPPPKEKCEQEAKKRGIDIERPLWPLEHVYVHMILI